LFSKGESQNPIKDQEPQLLLRGEEKGNLHHQKNTAPVHGVMFSAYLSLRKTASTSGEKAQNPTT
jgi:hypothetical protein